jgi:hypothetical protein
VVAIIYIYHKEGVGKSSLIATFVSRYFAEHGVPGVMTRVRLPPDPHSLCITTIVDSQAGDVALQQYYQYQQRKQQQPQPPQQLFSDDTAATTTAGFETPASTTLLLPAETTIPIGTTAASSLLVDTVDSIVLVYDLDRTETLTRLENHWLPLIERCYEGKVRTNILLKFWHITRPEIYSI